ncbi:MAG: MotA/TolQ/ExbB proton channel family protein [candidate division KSB1 bacterium]|nr:MotA/TolQ/ExbB proton channel family protein [candidate division KSB1 bacterium]MDZ7275257.1 MotA/TolQ/ExbB proton channel family protein [candidate division KSB1 bacterium]MDZ7287425.1 MotA/TolQ/ExbB proton channel family protein [candidate division KSB1 bacterium]MDZ7299539.1 MotA/TolQ/ExbB proton channel family protein [candidate division KSB1 bacterium]MDZ7309100.1 MotA/TolQ/ExbB proton channel family protein [candidate division KSB1 bacterium]
MKQGFFIIAVMVIALIIGIAIYTQLPKFIRDGGPIVSVLIALTIMVITFIFERMFSLKRAEGRGSMTLFLKKVQQEIHAGNIDGAIEACDRQRGSCANVIRNGLARYKELQSEGKVREQKEIMADVQHAIEEAMLLEVPLLEKNLVILSTIASIATMVGLFGTVIGMIRAFKAMAQAGVPDAVQLSLGISEALINTAGGIFAAILGIVFYNIFTTRVDNFTYMIDEASYNIVQTLALRSGNK